MIVRISLIFMLVPKMLLLVNRSSTSLRRLSFSSISFCCRFSSSVSACAFSNAIAAWFARAYMFGCLVGDQLQQLIEIPLGIQTAGNIEQDRVLVEYRVRRFRFSFHIIVAHDKKGFFRVPERRTSILSITEVP